jgi:hypothetical protein
MTVKNVSTNTIIIHWKQWWWKTLLWIMFASDHIWRIYWNVWIKQFDKLVSCAITDIAMLDNFEYSDKQWCILFDEMWLNFNSKNHSTDKNKQLSKFFFLVRKFNLSSIFISQRFNSVPVDMRELCDLIYEVKAIHRKNNHPLFQITRQTVNNEWFLDYEEEYVFDIIEYLNMLWLSYNTLESSIID